MWFYGQKIKEKNKVEKHLTTLKCMRREVVDQYYAVIAELENVHHFERIGSQVFIQSVNPGEDEKIIISMKTLFITQDWHDAIKQEVDTVSTTVYIDKVSLVVICS